MSHQPYFVPWNSYKSTQIQKEEIQIQPLNVKSWKVTLSKNMQDFFSQLCRWENWGLGESVLLPVTPTVSEQGQDDSNPEQGLWSHGSEHGSVSPCLGGVRRLTLAWMWSSAPNQGCHCPPRCREGRAHGCHHSSSGNWHSAWQETGDQMIFVGQMEEWMMAGGWLAGQMSA